MNLVNLIIKLTLNQTKVQVNKLEETIFCVYCTKRSLLLRNLPLCWGYINVKVVLIDFRLDFR